MPAGRPTKEEAFEYAMKIMHELDIMESKRAARKDNAHHFGKIDISDLLDYIYGEEDG